VALAIIVVVGTLDPRAAVGGIHMVERSIENIVRRGQSGKAG
jgi:hypothetical protein